MNVIGGYIVILVACLGGYALAGGHIHGLWQPVELIIIFGAALGAFIVTNSPKIIKATLKELPGLLKPPHYKKAIFMDLLCLLFETLSKVRKEGLMSIEKDIEDTHSSALFSKYPTISHDHHIMEFISDYLRMMVGGNLNPMEIESLMDAETETHHQEGHAAVAAISRLADGMPAFGIVAAVMGVVHTMESVGIPPAELGKMIGAALVGTFLGILISYGFIGPLATALEQKHDDAEKAFQCIKVTLLASMNGYAPAVAVEFGRKVLYSPEKPSFSELEEECKSRKGK